jgi:hypothetical protein
MSNRFPAYPKTPRFNMGCLVTEKIDGTNALIQIGVASEAVEPIPPGATIVPTDPNGPGIFVAAGSRKRWLTPEKDNFGFAMWVSENAQQIFDICGMGLHYGEWWGQGIQRGYAQNAKCLSLFDGPGRYPALLSEQCEHGGTAGEGNTCEPVVRRIPIGLHSITVVPLLYQGPLDHILRLLHQGPLVVRNELLPNGSVAQQGFMNTEGVIVALRGSGGGQRFKIVWEKG